MLGSTQLSYLTSSSQKFGAKRTVLRNKYLKGMTFLLQIHDTFMFTYLPVQFSYSVVSDSLQPHGLQQARPPCPSPTPGVYPNSCTLSRWCHPTISSSAGPFSSCLQSFPVPGSFQMSQFFTSGGQNIGVSASASVFQWILRTDFL